MKGIILCLAVTFGWALLCAGNPPGGIAVSDDEAASLVGGACDDYTVRSCTGTGNNCATQTKYTQEKDGPTPGNTPSTVYCSSANNNNCGNVTAIKKCSF